MPPTALSPIDVPLFYVGAVLALILRDRCKAAVCSVFGFPPRRQLLISMFGLVHVAPDTAHIVEQLPLFNPD